jgi:hypothetical protein
MITLLLNIAAMCTFTGQLKQQVDTITGTCHLDPPSTSRKRKRKYMNETDISILEYFI